MDFEIISEILGIEKIATGHGIKIFKHLNKHYGKTTWRKLKGVCHIRLEDGSDGLAEIHWYEGHGVGKVRIKIHKQYF
jgi:hypothetical protein